MQNKDIKEYGDDFKNISINAKENKKSHKKALITCAIIISFLVIVVASFSFWAIDKASNLDNLSKFNAEPNRDLIVTLCKSVLLGEEKDVTNSELNSYFTYAFEKYENKLDEQQKSEEIESVSNLKIDDIAIYFHKNSPSEIYIKALYKEDVYVFSAKVDIELDKTNKQFKIYVIETKVGELGLPTNIVLDILFNNDTIKTYTDILKREGNQVLAPSYIEEEFLGQTITFEIKSYEEKEGKVEVVTTSASDIIVEFLKELVSDIFK